MKDSPKEYAEELIKFFLPKMYCYFGSGMLTNRYDEKVALDNAKECALFLAEDLLKTHLVFGKGMSDNIKNVNFYSDTLKEIKNYETKVYL